MTTGAPDAATCSMPIVHHTAVGPYSCRPALFRVYGSMAIMTVQLPVYVSRAACCVLCVFRVSLCGCGEMAAEDPDHLHLLVHSFMDAPSQPSSAIAPNIRFPLFSGTVIRIEQIHCRTAQQANGSIGRTAADWVCPARGFRRWDSTSTHVPTSGASRSS
jgi:hypothetical protein